MTKPIRVLHCFGRMDRGGAETMIMNIYRNIDREQIQFDFVVHTTEKCAFDCEIYSLGGRIFNVPRYTVKNHFAYEKAWHCLFRNHSNEWKFIHGHMFITAAIYFKIAKSYGLATIAHSHSKSNGNDVTSFIKYLIQIPIKYYSDYRFACSKLAGVWLFGKKVCSKDNFFVFNNAITAKSFTYSEESRRIKRKELGLEGKFVIGNISRFDKHKNHNLIIKTFSEVYRNNENAALLLVGSGILIDSIKKQVEELALSNVVFFLGVRSDIPELLHAMDVFLLPSFFEGLGIVAVESQAAGLHTIVSEGIPKEAFLTDLIEMEYLKSPPSIWAKKVLKYETGYERKNTSEFIKAKGYDVHETAKWLEDFYLDLRMRKPASR